MTGGLRCRLRKSTQPIEAIHRLRPDVCVMVDNCYGEFTDQREPRADLLAGSLIKNPGGGLAPTGGYVAGKRALWKKWPAA